MASITAEKMRVILIDKETGKQTVLPGAVGTIQMGEVLPKPNPKTGLYSWQTKAKCRVHISRKMRKNFRKVFWTHRPRKYLAKSYIVRWIMEYDFSNIKTEEQLMKLSHSELIKKLAPIAFMVIEGETRKRWDFGNHSEYPCGGIVPNQDIEPNTGEMIICPAKAKQLRAELRPNLATIEKPSIDLFEIVRKATESSNVSNKIVK